MTRERDIISLALTESAVEVQGARFSIAPPEAFTLGVLLKNKPEYLSTADISSSSSEYSRRDVTVAIRSVSTKVNSREDVIGFRRQSGTGTRLFSMLDHVIETSMAPPPEPLGNIVVKDENWVEGAACDLQNATKFNTSENGKSRLLKQIVKTFCDGCFVKDDCLADAILTGNDFGIRGGTLPVERLPLIEAHGAYILHQKGAL